MNIYEVLKAVGFGNMPPGPVLRRSERLRQREERGREVRSCIIDSFPQSECLKPVDYTCTWKT